MSTDEQDQIILQSAKELKAKQTEQSCVRRKMNIFINAMQEAIEYYRMGQDDLMLEALKPLPGRDEITQTFVNTVTVKKDIEGLKEVLGIK